MCTQLNSLLQRVKDCNKAKITESPDHTPTPSPTHTSLAGLPTLPTHSSQQPTLNQEFEAALDELLGPEDNENILDVTIPDILIPGVPVMDSKLKDTSASSQLLTAESSPLGKLPPLNITHPEAMSTSMVKQQDDQLEQLLAAAVGSAPSESSEVPDYSADFNSESKKSTITSRNAPHSAAEEDKSLR